MLIFTLKNMMSYFKDLLLLSFFYSVCLMLTPNAYYTVFQSTFEVSSLGTRQTLGTCECASNFQAFLSKFPSCFRGVFNALVVENQGSVSLPSRDFFLP